jgi:hypothetical protein
VDQRVVELWDRIMSYGRTHEPMPIVDWRNEVLELHAAITDEESRIGLMRIYNLICDLVAARLEEESRDLAALEIDRRNQIWLFLRAECLVDGVMHPVPLLYVTTREVMAGRMSEDDPLRRYALGDLFAFDEIMPPPLPGNPRSDAIH